MTEYTDAGEGQTLQQGQSKGPPRSSIVRGADIGNIGSWRKNWRRRKKGSFFFRSCASLRLARRVLKAIPRSRRMEFRRGPRQDEKRNHTFLSFLSPELVSSLDDRGFAERRLHCFSLCSQDPRSNFVSSLYLLAAIISSGPGLTDENIGAKEKVPESPLLQSYRGKKG